MDKILTISLRVLARIPAGVIIDIADRENMDKEIVPCVRVSWYTGREPRDSWFSIKDGSYCGEAL